jgi:hypothetical protein
MCGSDPGWGISVSAVNPLGRASVVTPLPRIDVVEENRMTMMKVTAAQAQLTEAEVEHRLQTAEGISAVAGHYLDDDGRSLVRQSIRGELTPEEIADIAYAQVTATRN